jgi:hypothetical protein
VLHQALMDELASGYEFTDNGDGLYRRITYNGRTLAYLYPRQRRNGYYDRRVRVVWASPIDAAPETLREEFTFERDRNGREVTTVPLSSWWMPRIRNLLDWVIAHPVSGAHANRPRGARVDGAAALVRGRQIVALSERTMGLEIEFFGVARRDAENIVWNAFPRSLGWNIVYDGSVTRGAGGVGLELVTPIFGTAELSREEGFRQLGLILSELRAAGARVDRSCGVHVHLGAKDAKPMGIKIFMELWKNNQALIDLVVPASRRGQNHGFCKQLDSHYMQKVKTRMPADDRYWVVNPCAYAKFGTVEVRQLAGTLNLQKIQTWAEFSLHMFDYAARTTSRQGDVRTHRLRTRNGLVELLKEVGVSDDTRSFFEDRAVDFGAHRRDVYGLTLAEIERNEERAQRIAQEAEALIRERHEHAAVGIDPFIYGEGQAIFEGHTVHVGSA